MQAGRCPASVPGAARIRGVRSVGALAGGRPNRYVSDPLVPSRLPGMDNRLGTDRVEHRTFLIHGSNSTTTRHATKPLATTGTRCRQSPSVPGRARVRGRDAPRPAAAVRNERKSAAIRSRLDFLVRSRIVFEPSRWLPTTNRHLNLQFNCPSSVHQRTSESAFW